MWKRAEKKRDTRDSFVPRDLHGLCQGREFREALGPEIVVSRGIVHHVAD